MKKIIKAFREYFGNKVDIPDTLEKNGIIDDYNAGWYIRYKVQKDKNGNNYLDFTADHRMTNPRHERINSEGEITMLEMYRESFSYDPDITGDEAAKEKEFYEHNRAVSKILKEKGLED